MKETYYNYFQGKKITVMGLGLLGRGVGDAEFLAESGAEVLVTDLKSEAQLEDSVNRLRQYKNVTFMLGEHRLGDFENKDLILVSAGVPLDSPYLRHARKAGVPLTQSAALFAKLSKVPIIAVTGTRGKSTVTAMIHHTLELVTGEKVILGGNVRGVSNLQLFKQVKDDSLCVMELDSWQLQGFGWEGISPQIAVFTNFMEDHLNYYQRDGMDKEEAMSVYFSDKANIFLNQTDSGVLITTKEVFDRIKNQFKDKSLSQRVQLVDSSTLPEDCDLAVPGEHNRLNASLAFEALIETGLSEEEVLVGLSSFPGVEGRLQYLGIINGIKVYNDNNATTPQATVMGLEAVGQDKNVVLIVGGTDKGIELGRLPEAIARHCAHIILYSGTGTERLKAELPAGISYEEHDTLKDCVEGAFATAIPGNVILFSPGFASFNQEFKNEYDRNDQFVNLINKKIY